MANCGLLLNDGSSFLLLNDGSSVLLLNDNSCSVEAGTGTVADGGAGGYGKAWNDHWAEERKRQKKRDLALERLLESEEYKRLKRKLQMYYETLDIERRNWPSHAVPRIMDKIDELEMKIANIENGR